MNAATDAYTLQRPSTLYWCHNIKSLSCLEISSVTLTPMSSPESNLSTGLLTSPPAKPALLPLKPSEGCSIPRPRVNTLRFLFLSASLLFAVPGPLFSVVYDFHFYCCFSAFVLNKHSVPFVYASQSLFPWPSTQAGSISTKPQSTDIFDMVPFSPVTPLMPTLASNGCPPPPPTTLPPDISECDCIRSRLNLIHMCVIKHI